MGLDIYAGTLTRYYSHNWKTVTQQWAEENGWGFQKITPEGEAVPDEEEMTPEEIRADMESWRDQVLLAALGRASRPIPPGRRTTRNPIIPTSRIGGRLRRHAAGGRLPYIR